MRRSVLVLGSALVLVSGCASRATTQASGPSGSSAPSPSTSVLSTLTMPPTHSSAKSTPTQATASPTPSKTKVKYGFGLPNGPSAPGPELLVYVPLRQGDCDAAQTSLGEPDQGGNWSSLPDPAKVLLFQAGVAACTGDLSTASSLLSLDRKLFGATTKEDPQEADSACPLYQALVSVLDQVAPAGVQCPTGPEPQWHQDSNGNPIDPRAHQGAYEQPASSPVTTPTASPSPSVHTPVIVVHPTRIRGPQPTASATH